MTTERHRAHIVPFPLDHAIEHCVIARRNFHLGLWAGRALGLADAALQRYARSVVVADYEEPGRDDVIRKLQGDFAARGCAVSRAEIERELHRWHGDAIRQLAMSD
jgi:hypothetical protein